MSKKDKASDLPSVKRGKRPTIHIYRKVVNDETVKEIEVVAGMPHSPAWEAITSE